MLNIRRFVREEVCKTNREANGVNGRKSGTVLKMWDTTRLQGVAVTNGRRTFHLFYLCAKCGDVDLEELLKIIRTYGKRGQPDFESFGSLC